MTILKSLAIFFKTYEWWRSSFNHPVNKNLISLNPEIDVLICGCLLCLLAVYAQIKKIRYKNEWKKKKWKRWVIGPGWLIGLYRWLVNEKVWKWVPFFNVAVSFQCLMLIWYSLCFDSLNGSCFHHKSTIEATFPDSSPVKQNKTLGWEPSTEKMTVRDGSMKGDVPAYLKLVEGGNHRCYFTTTYT